MAKPFGTPGTLEPGRGIEYGLDRTASTVREGMIRAYLGRPDAWWKN
jgi:hypothetical protein